MPVERRHYLFGIPISWLMPTKFRYPKPDEPIFLRTIRRIEADDLGYSFAGESLAESIVVRGDSISHFTFNPNSGPMDRDLIGVYSREEIARVGLVGNLGCLFGLVGYRQRYAWS